MNNFKRLTIWVLCLGFFIPVGAGHGLVFMGIIEVGSIPGLFSPDLTFSLRGSYEDALIPSGLFFLISHVGLIVSLKMQDVVKNFWIKIGALFFGWVGFLYAVHSGFQDSVYLFSFYFALPMQISSVVLAARTIKAYAMIG